MTTADQEYHDILQRNGLSLPSPQPSLRDPATWITLAHSIREQNPNDALWCFQEAMEWDSACYAACEGAAEKMVSRGEHLKAIGYYAMAYSPALLNYSILDRIASEYKQTNLHEYYQWNLTRFARRIEKQREMPLTYDTRLHEDVSRALNESGIGRFTKDSPREIRFASDVAYDVYRLPDGRRNPTKHPTSMFHAAMQPSPAEFTQAIRNVLLPLLGEEESWLLGIPMAALDVFHVFPFVYLHPVSGPVVVIPMGTFGSLFAVNEILVTCQMAEDGEQALTSSMETLRAYLTGRGIVDELRKVIPLVIRPEREPLLNWKVWRRTVIQQVFMVLHEFGHVALGHVNTVGGSISFSGLFGRNRPAAHRLFWFPGDSAQEVAADEWAGAHLHGGIPGVEYVNGGIGWIDTEIKELFGLLGLLELSGDKAQHAHGSALERWQAVAKGLSILHMSGVVRNDEDVVDFRNPKKFLSRSVNHRSTKR